MVSTKWVRRVRRSTFKRDCLCSHANVNQNGLSVWQVVSSSAIPSRAQRSSNTNRSASWSLVESVWVPQVLTQRAKADRVQYAVALISNNKLCSCAFLRAKMSWCMLLSASFAARTSGTQVSPEPWNGARPPPWLLYDTSQALVPLIWADADTRSSADGQQCACNKHTV